MKRCSAKNKTPDPVEALASGLAHDFNNLLTAIKSRSSLVLHQIDPLDPVCHHISQIIKCTDKGLDIVNLLPGFKKSSESQPAARSNIQKTILAVDDEEMVLDILESMGRDLGYDVLKAQNAKEALSLFHRHRDDIMLVLLDMVFSETEEENGPEIFRQLQSMDPNVNVLIATGNPMDDSIEQMLEAGCKGLLFKPFSYQDFSRAVAAVAGTSKLHSK